MRAYTRTYVPTLLELRKYIPKVHTYITPTCLLADRQTDRQAGRNEYVTGRLKKTKGLDPPNMMISVCSTFISLAVT